MSKNILLITFLTLLFFIRSNQQICATQSKPFKLSGPLYYLYLVGFLVYRAPFHTAVNTTCKFIDINTGSTISSFYILLHYDQTTGHNNKFRVEHESNTLEFYCTTIHYIEDFEVNIVLDVNEITKQQFQLTCNKTQRK